MSKEEEAHRRYVYLKERIPRTQHVENGNLVPNNQKEFDEDMTEIAVLEKDYPHFNFFRNLNMDTTT